MIARLNSSPEGLAVKIATFEHQVGALRGHNLGIRTVLPDEQVCRPPYVEIGDQRYRPDGG